MNFADVKSACDQFAQLLLTTTSRSCVDAISVEEPTGTEDELHFYKLVLWCYVFWFEASHPAGKHVASLLRTACPPDYKRVAETFRSVQLLRTVRAHNLRTTTKDDEYKKTQAKLWVVGSGGEPTEWHRCCRRLCEDITVAVNLLTHTWTAVTNDTDHAETGVEQLRISVDREWPAYRFDQLVLAAAAELGLEGFDVVAYRTTRLPRWQELSRFFSDDRGIEYALRRAIFRELEDIFGGVGRGKVAISSRSDL